MADSSILTALLLYYLTPISAISLPISPQILSTNNTFPSIAIPSNISANLTVPTPPPGFSTNLKFNSSIHLKPLEVYICAIELMSILCSFPWTSTLSLSMEMSGHDASTELVLNPFPPMGGSRLEVRHAVLGLYIAGVAIAQGSKFYELEVSLFVGEEEVGWLEFQPKSGVLQSSDVTYLPSLDSNHANGTLTADSGKVIDPDDRSFAVTYSWDSVRVKSQDIFTTFLDSFAIAAQYNNIDPDAYIPAARSASGDMVLSTWAIGEGGKADMTWARLKKALIMIWNLLITGHKAQKARFEGLMFGFEYGGKSIGAGRILRFDNENDGTGVSTVEK